MMKVTDIANADIHNTDSQNAEPLQATPSERIASWRAPHGTCKRRRMGVKTDLISSEEC
jgi:hypothetical protein